MFASALLEVGLDLQATNGKPRSRPQLPHPSYKVAHTARHESFLEALNKRIAQMALDTATLENNTKPHQKISISPTLVLQVRTRRNSLTGLLMGVVKAVGFHMGCCRILRFVHSYPYCHTSELRRIHLAAQATSHIYWAAARAHDYTLAAARTRYSR